MNKIYSLLKKKMCQRDYNKLLSSCFNNICITQKITFLCKRMLQNLLCNSCVKNKKFQADHIGVASHVGKAIGLTHALRGLSQARGASELAMPRAVLLKHKVSQEKLLRGRGSDKEVQDAVFEVASCAKVHLFTARATTMPKELTHFLLPCVPADIYLDRLEKTNFDPYHPSLQKRQLTLPFTMWLNKFRGKF
jgi:NADH dehydrogenase [ubiquinone] 1 alpha subcomplex assembly factor 6